MSGRLPCPGCASVRSAGVEHASVVELAHAWARQPHLADRGEAGLRADIRADLGAELVRFLRCASCGLEFADPMRAWSAENYPDEAYGMAFDHLRALDLLRELAPLRLLEIGCAEGGFLERAAALGHRPTGLDFTARAVASARARGLDARVGDVAALREGLEMGERFEAVAMFQIVEHLCDPGAVFSELARMVAPGALLLVGCPSDLRYTRRLSHPDRVGSSDFWDWPPQHTLRWSANSLSCFLGRLGWVVERVEHEPFSALGAAAHVAALRGGERWGVLRRRVETIRALVELAAARTARPLRGVRLLLTARWEGS
jgi:2-polyprenyl-3-methyl-5-hydroxy-6-metoxy-1,4-benzoquinol methylase